MTKETINTGTTGGVQKTTNMDMADTVDSHSPYYTNYMTMSDLSRTLLKGTKGMKDAGKKYLTAAPLETGTSFKARLDGSVLLNAFGKTASFLAGQVFQTDLVFSDEVPDDFITYAKHIDPARNNINVFGKRVFQHGIGKGVSHILVDAPKREEGRTYTIQEEKDLKIRPYMKEVRAEDVIGWIVDEGEVVQVRIAETATVRKGDYGTKEVKGIRVLEKGQWFLYQQKNGKDWTKEDEGKFSVDHIPLHTYIPGEEYTQMTGETPLQDLAEINLRHWRSNSDQINILHVGRVPFLFGNKVDLTVLPSGVATMVSSDEDGADVKYIEVTGAAIAAGQTDLTELEAKMALWGLQQLIPRSGNPTATEKALTSGESNSSLGTWATEFEGFMQGAFESFGDFISQEFPEDGIKVNKEYSFGNFNSEEGLMLLKAVETGVISAATCFAELKRRNIISEHNTWEDEEDLLEDEDRGGGGEDDLTGTFFGGENQQDL